MASVLQHVCVVPRRGPLGHDDDDDNDDNNNDDDNDNGALDVLEERSTGSLGFRATWSADGVPHDSRHSLVTTRSRYVTTHSAPSGVQRAGHRLDSSSAAFPY